MSRIFIKSFKRPLIFSVILLLAYSVKAQETLQVVAKKVEKTIDFVEGYSLSIEGEKADVKVESWGNNKVQVKLEVVAKHRDKATAEKDLARVRYIIERVGQKIIVRNYLATDKNNTKPESSLKTQYVITIPENCPVDLRNHFGKADLANLSQQVGVRSEFCEIKLNNVRGEVDIETRFGDVVGTKLEGKVRIDAIRSDITLTRLNGSFDIKAKYGKIKIDANQSLIDLKIDAEKSDIIFLNPALATHNINLTAFYGKITVPDEMRFDFKEKNATVNKAELHLPANEGKISIQTSFGNIVVARVER